MSLSSLLVNRCTIKRWSPRTVGADYSLDTPDYQSSSTDVPCNIQEYSGTQVVTLGGQQVSVNARGYFQQGESIKPRGEDSSEQGDLVVLTTPATGVQYEVVAVLDQVGRQRFKKALLKLL